MTALTIEQQTFFIPDTDSPCDLWKTYFLQLHKAVGKQHAKSLWLVTWGERGAATCTTNADFNTWLQKNGIDVSSASTRAIADLSAIGGNFLGLGKNISKVLSIGTPILLGGVALAVVVLVLNTARKAEVSDLAALHPAGRMAKLGGGFKSMNR